MTHLRLVVALFALLLSGAARADTECDDAPGDWKPREELRRQVAPLGWAVQRIKVDDGCYELRGTDRHGNKVKAKYSPAKLQLRSLEIEFGPNGDTSDYLRPARPHGARREPLGPGRKGNDP
ncbi:MAG: hypothetical protein K0R43_2996 [Pseudoduganella sp.]|jgi:hypothetical protein|nr:hypothetical protein [Pseudoduganella sp.]